MSHRPRTERPTLPRPLARALRLALCALVLVPALALAGCGTDPSFADAGLFDTGGDVSSDIVTGFEASVDVPLPGRVCERNAQCDDGIDCTDDVCGPDRRCANLPNSGRCDDLRYCNGAERCDPRRGCVRGEPVSCDDSNVCTADRCVEETRTCEYRPLDRDGDGDPDDHCMARACGDAGVPEPDAGVMSACWRGRDCDDRDPRVNSRSPEICGDRVDNNCNGFVDDAEPGGCRRAPHDRCDDALDITAGGAFMLDIAPAQPDYPLGCLGGGSHDVVARFTLTEPRDVAIDGASSGSAVGLALQRAAQCGMSMGDPGVECDAGYPGRIRVHSLPAGEYTLIVSASGVDPVELSVQFTEATPQPTNDTCATAIEVPLTGATYRSDLIGLRDDVSTRCGGSARDALYRFTLTERRNVELQLAAGRGQYAQLSLLAGCGRTVPTLKCDAGATTRFTAFSLAPGEYFVAVESYDPITYGLQVSFAAPTPPPAGDVCADPLPLEAGTPRTHSAGDFENDYALSCYSSGRDAVFRFTLAERSDAMVDVQGGPGEYFGVAIQSACGERTGERACTANVNPRAIALSLDPGTYYALVKNGRGADFTVRLQTFAPVAPRDVTGNDTCATGYAIPMGRALLRGNTATLGNDYRSACGGATAGKDAVYNLEISTRTRVTMVLESAFYHALSITDRAGGCPGSAPMNASGSTCTLGTRSTMDVTLDPGSYHVLVDGLAAGNEGAYTLLVQTAPAM